MQRLSSPPESLVDTLSAEPGVQSSELRMALERIVGLTVDEALALVDELRHVRRWSIDTFMAAAECIDAARPAAN